MVVVDAGSAGYVVVVSGIFSVAGYVVVYSVAG